MILEYKKYLKKFKEGSKSFSFAALFLPKETRTNIAYLYYLCRVPDDIADGTSSQTFENFLAANDTSEFFSETGIPINYYEDLLRGLKGDMSFEFKDNTEDLLEYCYLVAGTVGIMSAHVLGFSNNKALEHAKNLGIAMQITNILRDVQEDAALGRIYFALEDLEKFNVSQKAIFEGQMSESIKDLLHFYEELALSYYSDASEGIKYISTWQGRLCVRIALRVYKGILLKIRKNDYNPFLGRVYVKTPLKIFYALSALKK